MKITKRQLKRVIRESILLTESHNKCVEWIIKMLQRLDDPSTMWWKIEDDARRVCKRKGVEFGPAFTEALQVFGIDY